MPRRMMHEHICALLRQVAAAGANTTFYLHRLPQGNREQQEEDERLARSIDAFVCEAREKCPFGVAAGIRVEHFSSGKGEVPQRPRIIACSFIRAARFEQRL